MKLIFLYHPKYPEAKRVDLDREDGPAEESRLTALGWSRKRFAQLVYHHRDAPKVCRTPEEVSAAVKAGWSTTSIPEPQGDPPPELPAVKHHTALPVTKHADDSRYRR